MFKFSITSRVMALLATGLFHALAFASPVTAPRSLTMPHASSLHYDSVRSARTGRIELSGQAELTGLLQAYWVRAWPDGETEHRSLFMRFFPDALSLARLPTIRTEEGRDAVPEVIQLYRGGRPPSDVFETEFPLETAIPLLDEVFHEVPAEFFRYREGFALTPARLSLQDLTSLIECDRRMFFGGFAAIAHTDTSPTERQRAQVRALESRTGCGAHAAYLEYYQVRTPAPGQSIGLHPAPDPASRPLTRLEPGSQVLKLRTINDHWVEIERLDDTATPMTPRRGYLPSDVLEPIN